MPLTLKCDKKIVGFLHAIHTTNKTDNTGDYSGCIYYIYSHLYKSDQFRWRILHIQKVILFIKDFFLSGWKLATHKASWLVRSGWTSPLHTPVPSHLHLQTIPSPTCHFPHPPPHTHTHACTCTYTPFYSSKRGHFLFQKNIANWLPCICGTI